MGQQGLAPGFRFSPTDEELVVYYLKNRTFGKDFHQGVIAEVDIYKHEPWDLPEKSALQSLDPVWYFFNAQDKRHSHTARINRTTSKGYWKATGKDRKISCGSHIVGIKKTLIYYEGRAPSGKRTDWIMHEYKLDEEFEKKSKAVCSIALCRIRKKGGPGPRNGEQYGASIFNEWGEDVEDDVDEKLPILSESRNELSGPSIPNQIMEPKLQGEMVLHNLQTEDCGSNDLSHAEGLDTNTALDMYAFLESFLDDDTEATSFEPEMVSSHPVMDKSFANHQHFDSGTNSDFCDLVDIQSLFDFDGKNVHDILHPTSGEEQILGELYHLAGGGQLHANNIECNARMTSQLPAYSDGIVYGYDVSPSGVAGDFIELDDINSPLDGFVMRSPLQGNYYVTEEQEPPSALDEYFEGSPDLLYTQGSAARRARLQIAPPSANMTHVNMEQQINTMHPKVQCRESSSDINIQVVGGTSSQNITSLSSGSSSDSEEISNVMKLSKFVSPYTVTKCEKVPPQLFFTATTGSQDEESSIIDSKKVAWQVGAVSSRQQNISSGVEKESTVCEAGSGSPLNTNSCSTQEAGVDCEAGLNPTVVRESELRHSVATSSHGTSAIGELVSKVKSLTLGSDFVQLESNLSTTFNDKVFALGKPVAQLFPSKDYVNPYRSLRRGAMASLFRLVIAVLLLFFLFVGIHMLTKYVLSILA